MSGKTKGSSYEREIAGMLSLWWSKEWEVPSDCIFWRTASSGGRSTQRAKVGKNTSGHAGDISATDGVGSPLIELLAIEIKRGYSLNTIADLLDKTESSALQVYDKWITQCKASKMQGNTFSWLLITKRDRKEPIVFFPSHLLIAFREVGCKFHDITNLRISIPNEMYDIVGMKLKDLLSKVHPDHIRLLLDSWKK